MPCCYQGHAMPTMHSHKCCPYAETVRRGCNTTTEHAEEPLNPCTICTACPGVGTRVGGMGGGEEHIACTARRVMTTFSSSLRTEVQVIYRHKLPLHQLSMGRDFVHKYRSQKLPSVKKQAHQMTSSNKRELDQESIGCNPALG